MWHFGRLALASRDGLGVLVDCCDKSIRIVSVSQQIDIKSADCSLIGSVLRGVAEMDKETRRERTKLGLAVARARGREGGRPAIAPDDAKVIQGEETAERHVARHRRHLRKAQDFTVHVLSIRWNVAIAKPAAHAPKPAQASSTPQRSPRRGRYLRLESIVDNQPPLPRIFKTVDCNMKMVFKFIRRRRILPFDNFAPTPGLGGSRSDTRKSRSFNSWS